MENVGRLLQMCMEGMNHTFYIYGYPISMWQIYIFEFVALTICFIIVGFFMDWW